MTEALPVERFEQLRGEPDDGSWAGTVQLRLLQGQLDPREVDRLMGQVEQAVVDSGEGPETLYGDPSAWAEEALAEASQQGATFVDNDSSPAELVTVALFLAAGWATAVMAAAMAPVVMGAGWLALRAGSLGSHSAWWWLAQAALWAALAALAARVLPDPGGRRVPTAGMDDVQWVAETRTRLRERGDLTERQVTQALDEARSHAQQSGTALAEEFGSPIGYARSLPGSEVTRRRRETLLWAIATVVYGWLALDTTDGGFWRWVGPALALIAGVLTLRAMLRWQRARRRTRP